MRSKLPEVGTTIFSVMSALANECGALNLSQGFPEFDCDPRLQELVARAIRDGKNQYAPMAGLPQLREVLADKMNEAYDAALHPDQHITITAGGTQAIYTAITAVVEPGDEVIVFDPAYDCYEPAVTLCGGKTIHVNLSFPEYSVPWEEVEECMNDRTKLIIINSPHNPSGALISENDIRRLEELCERYGTYVLSDEVYEHITFDGKPHLSVLGSERLRSRSFVVFSFGKTFHTTGWKMGYCVAPSELTTEFRKVHQFLVFSCNTPIQYALAEYMSAPDTYLGLPAFYQAKRDIFRAALESSRFEVLDCHGTYFQLLGYQSISEDRDVDLAKKLTREIGVASIPTSVFYADNTDHRVLRFCFAKEDQTLIKAAEILCQI